MKFPESYRFGGEMKFSIRDIFWVVAFVALITSWLLASRRQNSHIRVLERQLRGVEFDSQMHEDAAKEYRTVAEQLAGKEATEQLLTQQRQIVELRDVVKQSIEDQRDWFSQEVREGRMLAIAPATTLDPVSEETVRRIEAATGIEAFRLRRLLGIEQSEEVPNIRLGQ